MGPGVGYDYLFEKKILQKKCNVFVIHLGKYHNPKTNIFSINDHETAIKILEKEIELLNLQIQEIKTNSSNPLG